MSLYKSINIKVVWTNTVSIKCFFPYDVECYIFSQKVI